MNSFAYWFLSEHDENDIPTSDVWTNSVFHIDQDNSELLASISIVKDLMTHRTGRSAFVTDDHDVYTELHKHFISNNIIMLEAKPDWREIVSKQIKWILSDFGKDKLQMNDVFFCSDLHFNHANIIKYCNRPWNSGKDEKGELIVTEDDVNRMNEDLVANWNSIVPTDGIVWFLGDFCLGQNQKEKIPEFVSRLNGKINIVLGNHDHHSVDFYYKAGFNRVYDRKIIINDFVVLSHAPMEFVKAPFFNVYGHVHNCETYDTWSKDSCCVCVERHNYKPVSWKEIKKQHDELNAKYK